MKCKKTCRYKSSLLNNHRQNGWQINAKLLCCQIELKGFNCIGLQRILFRSKDIINNPNCCSEGEIFIFFIPEEISRVSAQLNNKTNRTSTFHPFVQFAASWPYDV